MMSGKRWLSEEEQLKISVWKIKPGNFHVFGSGLYLGHDSKCDFVRWRIITLYAQRKEQCHMSDKDSKFNNYLFGYWLSIILWLVIAGLYLKDIHHDLQRIMMAVERLK